MLFSVLPGKFKLTTMLPPLLISAVVTGEPLNIIWLEPDKLALASVAELIV